MKTPPTIEVKITADTTELVTGLTDALRATAEASDNIRRDARRVVAYRDARHGIAAYLMAHDVEASRAYAAATDILGEDFIDMIERG